MPKSMLITAGPTQESIDSVRYIANRSSGKLGIAVAEAARAAGWSVTLLLGPVAVDLPGGMRILRFESAADLESLLKEHFPACDVLVMAAAVADYRPARVKGGKTERSNSPLTLNLEPTPDLVAACAQSRRPGQKIIGFALEEQERLAAGALEKLHRKCLDAVVANPLNTMGDDTIDATVYLADGTELHPPGGGRLAKTAFAEWLIHRIAALHEAVSGL